MGASMVGGNTSVAAIFKEGNSDEGPHTEESRLVCHFTGFVFGLALFYRCLRNLEERKGSFYALFMFLAAIPLLGAVYCGLWRLLALAWNQPGYLIGYANGSESGLWPLVFFMAVVDCAYDKGGFITIKQTQVPVYWFPLIFWGLVGLLDCIVGWSHCYLHLFDLTGILC